MSKNPAMKGLLAIAMACFTAAPVWAQAGLVAQVLSIRPSCDDVAYTTPAPEDVAKCNAEVFKLPNGGSGYHLTDGDKRTLRKFVDSDADGKVDTWSYYKDGAEVYREAKVGNGYSFRWVGAGGMKWGNGAVDKGKARIETWRMISADEAAQEAFQALATGDFDRLKALFITPQEIQALGLPADEAQRILNLQKNAAANFQKIRTALPNLPKATFSRLENAKPGSYPADLTGGKADIVKIPSGLILFENEPANPKKHDWINSYEIVQVGNVWRLTDVPGPDSGGPNPEFVKWTEKLNKHDAAMPAPGTGKLGPWTLQRVEFLQKIAESSKPEDRENWYKQIPDNLAAAIVDGDSSLTSVLTKWKNDFAAAAPGGAMAAYATYREILSSFQLELKKNIKPGEYVKLLEKHHEDLAKYIQAYPKSDDAPDALIQIATGSEFSGKEDEAKKWYGQIVANYANSSNAPKAAGAIRRLDSAGKNFVLAGPTLNGRNYTLAPGKVTVVYYWASYSGQAIGDFATLKKLQQNFGKDLEIVGVNLDEKAAQANAFLQNAPPLTAEHLHQSGGGINGQLASYYGIFGLPHLFLLDRDGKVVSNKVQTNALEEEIAKLVKK